VLTGAGRIVRAVAARHAAPHSYGIVMIQRVAQVLAETGVGLTAAIIHAPHALQLNTGTAILNQHAVARECTGANQAEEVEVGAAIVSALHAAAQI